MSFKFLLELDLKDTKEVLKYYQTLKDSKIKRSETYIKILSISVQASILNDIDKDVNIIELWERHETLSGTPLYCSSVSIALTQVFEDALKRLYTNNDLINFCILFYYYIQKVSNKNSEVFKWYKTLVLEKTETILKGLSNSKSLAIFEICDNIYKILSETYDTYNEAYELGIDQTAYDSLDSYYKIIALLNSLNKMS
jgi:hypothetical protein